MYIKIHASEKQVYINRRKPFLFSYIISNIVKHTHADCLDESALLNTRMLTRLYATLFYSQSERPPTYLSGVQIIVLLFEEMT